MIMSLLRRIKFKLNLRRQQRQKKIDVETSRRKMVKDVKQANEAVKQAGRNFDEAMAYGGRSDVDIASLKLKDAQQEYVSLLIKAREQGIQANFSDLQPLQARA
jgi:hypothetical protein